MTFNIWLLFSCGSQLSCTYFSLVDANFLWQFFHHCRLLEQLLLGLNANIKDTCRSQSPSQSAPKRNDTLMDGFGRRVPHLYHSAYIEQVIIYDNPVKCPIKQPISALRAFISRTRVFVRVVLPVRLFVCVLYIHFCFVLLSSCV